MAPDDASDREAAKKFGRLVARAWSDEGFKKRLVGDPRTVLQELGIDIPAGVDVKVVENTSKVIYINLPRQPVDNLTADALARRPMLCYWSVCCSTRDIW